MVYISTKRHQLCIILVIIPNESFLHPLILILYENEQFNKIRKNGRDKSNFAFTFYPYMFKVDHFSRIFPPFACLN